jgi:beta-lactamase regulating signal transducer with metallopeptidase domain
MPSSGLRAAASSIGASGAVAWAAGLYGAVAGVLLIRIIAGLAGIRRLLAKSIVLGGHEAEARELALVRACAAEGALLIESADVSVPATAGAWRPHVVLPAGWRELEVEAVQAAVRHELAHVRRADHAVIIAAHVIRALFWFHPVAWLALRQLRWFAELACDAAAAGPDGADAYAHALLLIARRADRRCPAFMLGALSQVGQRVALLVDAARGLRGRRRVGPLTICGLALLLLLPVIQFTASALVASPHATRHAMRHAHHS